MVHGVDHHVCFFPFSNRQAVAPDGAAFQLSESWKLWPVTPNMDDSGRTCGCGAFTVGIRRRRVTMANSPQEPIRAGLFSANHPWRKWSGPVSCDNSVTLHELMKPTTAYLQSSELCNDDWWWIMSLNDKLMLGWGWGMDDKGNDQLLMIWWLMIVGL